MHPYQPTYREFICENLFIFYLQSFVRIFFICENLFLFVIICFYESKQAHEYHHLKQLSVRISFFNDNFFKGVCVSKNNSANGFKKITYYFFALKTIFASFKQVQNFFQRNSPTYHTSHLLAEFLIGFLGDCF